MGSCTEVRGIPAGVIRAQRAQKRPALVLSCTGQRASEPDERCPPSLHHLEPNRTREYSPKTHICAPPELTHRCTRAQMSPTTQSLVRQSFAESAITPQWFIRARFKLARLMRRGLERTAEHSTGPMGAEMPCSAEVSCEGATEGHACQSHRMGVPPVSTT